jgi:hypothetical protein
MSKDLDSLPIEADYDTLKIEYKTTNKNTSYQKKLKDVYLSSIYYLTKIS